MLSPYDAPGASSITPLERYPKLTTRFLSIGFLLGALIPAVAGLVFISSVMQFSSSDRMEASCGTSAAGGILLIMVGSPLGAIVGAVLGAIFGFIVDLIRH